MFPLALAFGACGVGGDVVAGATVVVMATVDARGRVGDPSDGAVPNGVAPSGTLVGVVCGGAAESDEPRVKLALGGNVKLARVLLRPPGDMDVPLVPLESPHLPGPPSADSAVSDASMIAVVAAAGRSAVELEVPSPLVTSCFRRSKVLDSPLASCFALAWKQQYKQGPTRCQRLIASPKQAGPSIGDAPKRRQDRGKGWLTSDPLIS